MFVQFSRVDRLNAVSGPEITSKKFGPFERVACTMAGDLYGYRTDKTMRLLASVEAGDNDICEWRLGDSLNPNLPLWGRFVITAN